MSEASSADFWQCVNPACSAGGTIPLSIGSTFSICPFCGTSQSQDNQYQKVTDGRQDNCISEPQPELGKDGPDVSSSVGHGHDAGTAVSNNVQAPPVVAAEGVTSSTGVDREDSSSIQDSKTTVSQSETKPIKAEEPSSKGKCATSNQQLSVTGSAVSGSEQSRGIRDEASGVRTEVN